MYTVLFALTDFQFSAQKNTSNVSQRFSPRYLLDLAQLFCYATQRNRIFFVVSRALKKGAFSPIYRSEVQTRDQLSKFDDVTLSSQVLHGGNASRLFRLEVYRYYKNYSSTLLGFVQTSLEKLKTMNHGGQLYWWPAVRGFPSVNVKVINVKLDEGGQTQGTNWFCLRMTGW